MKLILIRCLSLWKKKKRSQLKIKENLNTSILLYFSSCQFKRVYITLTLILLSSALYCLHFLCFLFFPFKIYVSLLIPSQIGCYLFPLLIFNNNNKKNKKKKQTFNSKRKENISYRSIIVFCFWKFIQAQGGSLTIWRTQMVAEKLK